VIDLTGASVVVTGASGGIGAAIAMAFAAAGADVVVHHRGDAVGGAALAAEIGGIAVGGDVTDPMTAAALVAAAVSRSGRLDVLVNNAAVQPVVPLVDMTEAEWRAVVDTNLTGTFLCTDAATRQMIAQGGGGAIIHIASIEGSHPAAGHAHYAASKAAVIMHARAAALELGPFGIRVNSVSPGLVHRPRLEDEWPEGVARWHAAAPLGALVRPEDVASACLFLASPLAAAVTGHDLVVDAGVSAHPTW
jgi:3-oxoacyl-[acyl-carrier protein] reductase